MDNDSSNTNLMKIFYKLNSTLLTISVSGTLFLLLMNLIGFDKKVAEIISNLLAIDLSICYWLFYLVGSSFFLIVNCFVTYSYFQNYTIKSGDSEIIKNDILKKRRIYNFSSKRSELMSIPKYLYFIFFFSGLVMFVSSVNELVIIPMERLSHLSDYDNIFSFHKNDHPVLFLFMLSPPYIFLWIIFFVIKRKI